MSVKHYGEVATTDGLVTVYTPAVDNIATQNWVKKYVDEHGGGTITVDSELSETSENPVQNKVIKQALDGKQPVGDYLTSIPSEYITESELQSKNYATTSQLNNKADKVVKVDGGNGDITLEIEPNKFYVFGECTNLTITLAAETNGIYNEYLFKFDSGDTATVLADIADIKWINDKTIQPNKTYIVSIVSGLGVIGGA